MGRKKHAGGVRMRALNALRETAGDKRQHDSTRIGDQRVSGDGPEDIDIVYDQQAAPTAPVMGMMSACSSSASRIDNCPMVSTKPSISCTIRSSGNQRSRHFTQGSASSSFACRTPAKTGCRLNRLPDS